MFQTIRNYFVVKDIRNKILFTIAMLVIFRVVSFIPAPNVNTDVLDFYTGSGSVFGILDIFGGGALSNFSIIAMGVMPYITASIIVQLLQMDVVPKFTEWSKQGEVGRRKLAQFTRYLAIVFAFFQASAMSFGFSRSYQGFITDDSIWSYALIALVLTAGSAFLMWLGEQITEHGVGNGISFIIFAGIASAIPSGVSQIYTSLFSGKEDQLFIPIVTAVLLVIAVIAIVVVIIFIQQALRKIPVQYAKSNAVTGNTQSSHLPLKVNSAGVIPVIFAISFIVTPPTIASFFPANDTTRWITNTFDYTQPIGMVMYAVLIILFTYFYSFVQVNPEQVAENLQKQGGYVPGIRPGKTTEEYLTRVLYRLTFVGAIFLTAVSLLPMLFTNVVGLPQTISIGGTGLLIVVGVALESMKQIEGQLVKRNYKGFIK